MSCLCCGEEHGFYRYDGVTGYVCESCVEKEKEEERE